MRYPRSRNECLSLPTHKGFTIFKIMKFYFLGGIHKQTVLDPFPWGPLKRRQETLKNTYVIGSFSWSFFLRQHRLGHLCQAMLRVGQNYFKVVQNYVNLRQGQGKAFGKGKSWLFCLRDNQEPYNSFRVILVYLWGYLVCEVILP